MFTGTRSNYYWVEWQGKFLDALLSAFPQIVMGKYLVNTSFDSSTLNLSPEDGGEGWSQHGQLAVSPRMTDGWLPHAQYDEWYVFTSPTTFDEYEVFVNYLGFSLRAPVFEEFQERFWWQLDRLAPESFLADGDHLICVTRDLNLFQQLLQWGDEAEETFD